MSETETPHPPATPEFGHVLPGGPAHTYPGAGPVTVKKFTVGPWDNNVYVIACEGEAIIVDGANEAERILSEVKGLEVTSIVQTHNHPDHTQALPRLVDDLGVPVYAHPEDPMPVTTESLEDGRVLRVGGAELTAMHTPGHTPGSTCYVIGEQLFTGDTLFPGGPGNTDGDPGRFTHPTRISPGHGLDTTLGRERPYLEVWRGRGW
jgi:glyoxylase-like metal-dependent hydrolase (beta-lactamase superfamily II)